MLTLIYSHLTRSNGKTRRHDRRPQLLQTDLIVQSFHVSEVRDTSEKGRERKSLLTKTAMGGKEPTKSLEAMLPKRIPHIDQIQ